MNPKYSKFRLFIYIILLPLGLILPMILGLYDDFENKANFWKFAVIVYFVTVGIIICMAISMKD